MAAFGTSGLRALVSELRDSLVYTYVQAYLRYLETLGEFRPGMEVLVGGDLRPSTPAILEAAWQAIGDLGGEARFAGMLPSPALALAGFQAKVPSLMITGSHIPFDRNGIKFNRPAGELAKADEIGIQAALQAPDPDLFTAAGQLRSRPRLPAADPLPLSAYLRRYQDFFPNRPLARWRVGVYQHSGVARDLLPQLLTSLGAQVITLGRSEEFVPMDTEALRPEDRARAMEWTREHGLDALLSTDGDADRPMLADERGLWWRGDQLGLLCAAILGADAVVTPISSNTALERSGLFAHCVRTRIGSPYVIAGMEQALQLGYRRVIGYEANGGLLLGADLIEQGRHLTALPTRDAMLPMLAAMVAASTENKPLSALLENLPKRYTASDRVQDFPTDRSQKILEQYADGEKGLAAFTADFAHLGFRAIAADTTDGVRMRSDLDEYLHLRPSGNAPELRCYVEASTSQRADALLQGAMVRLHSWQQA